MARPAANSRESSDAASATIAQAASECVIPRCPSSMSSRSGMRANHPSTRSGHTRRSSLRGW